jgi:hypothetical protein
VKDKLKSKWKRERKHRKVPLKGKRFVFAWSNFHLEVEKRICLVEFSFGRAVLSLGIVLWCVEKFAEFSFG